MGGAREKFVSVFILEGGYYALNHKSLKKISSETNLLFCERNMIEKLYETDVLEDKELCS
jgi:hypothetical protein